MTLGDLKTSLKYLLGDPNQQRFSDADKGQFLNDASRLVAALCPVELLISIAKKGTGTTSGGKLALAIDFGRLVYGVTWNSIPARRRSAVSNTNTLTDGTAAAPIWWYDGFSLSFSPTTAMAVEYWYIPTDVTMASDSTECPLPDALHPAVLKYAAYIGLLGADDQKASVHLQQAITIIGNLVRE